MLKCEISNGKGKVEFRGTVQELTNDLTMAVNGVFSNLKNGPVPEQAASLRYLLIASLLDPESSAWADNSATKIGATIPMRKKED